jgi:hypothetical protein
VIGHPAFGRTAVAGLLVAACSLLVALPAGLATAAPAAAGPTVVVQVSPVGPSGYLQPGYRVVHTYGGATCKSRSFETGNAYSCHVRVGYDPCWVTATRSNVVCLSSPYSHSVTRLRVARYVNAGGLGAAAGLPWGLLLANGARSTLIPGNFGTVGSYQIHYSYNEFKTVLVGPIDKTGAVWRIRKARNVGRFHFKLDGWADIKKTWVGEASTLS